RRARRQLEALAPGVADILEEGPGGAGRADREDVVGDVGAKEGELSVEPGRETAPRAELVAARLDGLQRRIGGDPGLQARTDRAWARARQLQEGGRAEPLA